MTTGNAWRQQWRCAAGRFATSLSDFMFGRGRILLSRVRSRGPLLKLWRWSGLNYSFALGAIPLSTGEGQKPKIRVQHTKEGASPS